MGRYDTQTSAGRCAGLHAMEPDWPMTKTREAFIQKVERNSAAGHWVELKSAYLKGVNGFRIMYEVCNWSSQILESFACRTEWKGFVNKLILLRPALAIQVVFTVYSFSQYYCNTNISQIFFCVHSRGK